jgi:biopolymer transport protein ExbD
VEANGRISLNDQTVELPALKQMLVAMKTSDRDTSVVVRGAADVDYNRVISVLDILQQVDITKVGLATETVQQ